MKGGASRTGRNRFILKEAEREELGLAEVILRGWEGCILTTGGLQGTDEV